MTPSRVATVAPVDNAKGERMVASRWTADTAFEKLVTEHRPAWLRLAIMLTGSTADAEDVLQEALIAVARVWPEIRRPGAAAYVRKAIVRKSIDLHRRTREFPSMAGQQPAAVDNILRFQQDRDFFAMLQSLPHHQRAALVCRFYLDLDDRSTARILECAESTVRSHIHRGLQHLRATEERTQP